MDRIKISEIMDEYTDNDMILNAESDIDTEKVKKNVLKMTKRRTIKKPVKAIIAIAAAAACLSAVTVTADLPERFFGSVHGKTNALVILNRGGVTWRMLDDVEDPFEYRDGRIIFTAMGGEEDITDLIDDETPYIASYTSFETGMTNYIAVGGTPGHTGFQEFINFGTKEEPCWGGYGVFAQKGGNISVYGVNVNYCGLTFEQEGELEQCDVTHYSDYGYAPGEYEAKFVKLADYKARLMPWVVNAAKEIDVFEAKERMNEDVPFEIDDYQFIASALGGGLIFMDSSHDYEAEMLERVFAADISLLNSSPIEVRDERIFVTVNGEEKDITDLIDENTPYIEAIEGPLCETWLIAGGTAENCAGVVVYNIANNTLLHDTDTFRLIDRANNLIALGDRINTDNYFAVDGEEISLEQLKEYLMQGVDLTGRFTVENSSPEWYKAACEELAIDVHLSYAE